MSLTSTRGDLRQTILDAVDRLLARYGYQKMTIEDLAREAGVARRTIYLHFPGKEAVALASIDRVVERLLERLRDLAKGAEPPDQRIRAMLRERILFRLDAVQDYYRSFDDLFAALRPAYIARRDRYFAAEAEVFAGVVAEGCGAGVFADFPPRAVADTLLLATNSLLPYSLGDRELGSREEVAERVGRVADLLLNGLLQRTQENLR